MQKLTPESDGSSKDLLADNIAKLKELFPEVFAEGKIDFDALKQLLGDYVETADERYSFTWNGKSKARWLAQTRSMGTLRPCPEESVNWDTTQNLFIEGDNLEVLKQLQKSYYKKIKMIYIDPPYNTGNDFIYPDNFRDSIKNYMELTGQTDGEGRKLSTNPETSGRFHTDWLNMMYPRLKLARNLLRDDGVIFISIDDNEVANLRKICDEVFGEENFLSQIIVQSNKRGQTYKQIAKTHEYLLLYLKNELVELNEFEKQDGSLPFKDSFGAFDLWELRNRNPKFGRFNRPNLYFPIYVAPDLVDECGYAKVSLTRTKTFSDEALPLNSEHGEGCWRWSKGKITGVELANSSPVIVARKRKDGVWNIYEKSRKGTTKAKSIWTENEVISEQGTMEIGEFGLAQFFEHPKPKTLMTKCLHLGMGAEEIILDFFSGSCTTAHAVLELNKQDGGNRKFIMVQLPEPCGKDSEAFKAGYKNIAEIGKERIRRVIKKLNDEDATTTAKATQNPALFSAAGAGESAAPRVPDRGFKVFKLDSSNIKTWDPNFNQLEHTLLSATEKMKPDRTEADVLYEVLLKYGLDLTLPIEKRTIAERTVYIIGGGTLVVCLGMNMTLKIVEQIAALKDEFKPESPPGMRMVFKDNGFANDTLKTNAVQILKQRRIEDVRAL